MSQLDRQIRQCNNLLAAELGSINGIAPAFQWFWSNDLYAPAPAENSNGEPVFDLHCACGTNVRIHQPNCLLEIAQQRFEVFRVAPTIPNRWALCRWIVPPPEQDWIEAFGNLGSYPRNGTYVPLSINDQAIALKRGVVPTEELTWKLIHSVKNSATIRQVLAQYREQCRTQDERAVIDAKGNIISRPSPKAKEWWNHRDRLREEMTTFGQIPGSRDSHVSYPSSKPKSERKSN